MSDVDRLASIAAQLVARVRDDDPAANARWLAAELPDPPDREALLYVLAAAVPCDVPWSTLTAWAVLAEKRSNLRPHGTLAAVRRHNYHSEPLCGPCRNVERDRKRAARRASPSGEVAA